ncbi:DNA polymerase [Herbinix hemicellulosilytica]|uniref:DNA-directed DNA polymerase n=2 Tax=Herbinix hemicellulosilytica TaxID=1564487 RepID=A0A0H5SX71_HERHM|nr:DNA polymerase [Herbinix hemicellulosilytica]CRZ34948.1 DNA polymerase [Herbinix hemicellulosilytica]
MLMKTLAIDIETYSSVDLTEAGVYAYCDTPDFEILLIGYKFDDDTDVTVIDTVGMDLDDIELLYPEFVKALLSPDVIKTAFNANFERTCLGKYFGYMPPEQWRCTAVHAAMLGLPRSLEDVGNALGLPEDKQKNKIGKSLIDYFCKPCKPTKSNGGRTRNLPQHDREKWDLFKEYNKQDVIAEQAILDKLKIYPVPDWEWALWCFDQRMNDRGICLDMDFVQGIIKHDDKVQAELAEEAKELTGLSNPNSPVQLKEWLTNKLGHNVDSLTKDSVKKLIDDITDETVKRVLEIRQAMSKTSTAKYKAMEKAVCSDGRLRGILQFYGANRTGRWAGRIVQVHNLPQNKIPDIELARQLVADKDFETVEILFGETPFVFSQLVRTAFIPSPGCRFVVSDFSAIEARVISWLADEEWRLEVFRTHGKIYEASASQMFNVPIDRITKGSPLRQKGKVAELALGYQGSVGALIAMGALDMGIPQDELPMLVNQWRDANKKIVKLWYTVEAAAKTAIQEHRTVKIQHGLEFSYINKILFIKLPSGRKLAYYSARIEPNSKGMDQITYAGIEQDSKRWGRLETYGGKLVENIVQAIARDCLAEALLRIERAGYNVVMHVHDEIICDVPIEDKEAPEKINAIMSQEIGWAPGLPLKGDTFESPFYRKD